MAKSVPLQIEQGPFTCLVQYGQTRLMTIVDTSTLPISIRESYKRTEAVKKIVRDPSKYSTSATVVCEDHITPCKVEFRPPGPGIALSPFVDKSTLYKVLSGIPHNFEPIETDKYLSGKLTMPTVEKGPLEFLTVSNCQEALKYKEMITLGGVIPVREADTGKVRLLPLEKILSPNFPNIGEGLFTKVDGIFNQEGYTPKCKRNDLISFTTRHTI